MPPAWRSFVVEWVAGDDPGECAVVEWSNAGGCPVVVVGRVRQSSSGAVFVDSGADGALLMDLADRRLRVLGRVVALRALE